MPFVGITQIPYSPRGEGKMHLTNQQVHEILINGKPYATQYGNSIFLRKSVAPFQKVPCVIEFSVLLEGRRQDDGSDPFNIAGRLLDATFRPNRTAIEEGFTEAKPESQPNRHLAAHLTSMAAGVEIIPISVERDFSNLLEEMDIDRKNPLMRLALAGKGTLSARVISEPLFVHDFNMGKKIVREDLPFKRQTFIAALLFDMLIGSGQRDADSYLIDEDGRVRTIYHQEAFTYTAQDDLCRHLEQEYLEIATAYRKALQDLHDNPRKRTRLILALNNYIQQEEIERLFNLLGSLLNNKQVCGQELTIG